MLLVFLLFLLTGVGIAALQTFTQLSGSWPFISLSMGISRHHDLYERCKLHTNTQSIWDCPGVYNDLYTNSFRRHEVHLAIAGLETKTLGRTRSVLHRNPSGKLHAT